VNPLIEVLAVFCHGFAACCNVFGVIYNWFVSRRVDRDVVMNAAAGVFHTVSALKHAKRLKGGRV
jgi:hypothetical protein